MYDTGLITDTRPLILTAKLDAQSQTHFDELRREHFPPKRNFLGAHLTLFHTLPATEIDEITVLLADVSTPQRSFPAVVAGLRFLGAGVAFDVRSTDLEKLRREIASTFHHKLTPQDQQTWRPHITIQNKVSGETARKLMARLDGKFRPWTISIEGLQLWRYDGGPWLPIVSFHFGTVRNPSTAVE